MLTIRIPDDLRQRIQAMADQERRSLSKMTVLLLEEALNSRAANSPEPARV